MGHIPYCEADNRTPGKEITCLFVKRSLTSLRQRNLFPAIDYIPQLHHAPLI